MPLCVAPVRVRAKSSLVVPLSSVSWAVATIAHAHDYRRCVVQGASFLFCSAPVTVAEFVLTHRGANASVTPTRFVFPSPRRRSGSSPRRFSSSPPLRRPPLRPSVARGAAVLQYFTRFCCFDLPPDESVCVRGLFVCSLVRCYGPCVCRSSSFSPLSAVWPCATRRPLFSVVSRRTPCRLWYAVRPCASPLFHSFRRSRGAAYSTFRSVGPPSFVALLLRRVSALSARRVFVRLLPPPPRRLPPRDGRRC